MREEASPWVFASAAKRDGLASWFPRTIIYAREVGKLELFARAVSKKGFAPLKVLIPVADAAEILSLIGSAPMRRVYESPSWFHVDMHIGRLFNLEDIARASGIGPKES